MLFEYTPSTEDVRSDFIDLHTRNFDSYQTGRTLTSEQGLYGSEFDRWLDNERASVWDEAIADADEAGWLFNYGTEYMSKRNPYREEEDVE